MKIETISEQRERVLRQAMDRRVPGRTIPRGASWVGHDQPGGKAQARRLRQMASGILDKVCACGGVVPRGRAVAICDACLEARWHVAPKNRVDKIVAP